MYTSTSVDAIASPAPTPHHPVENESTKLKKSAEKFGKKGT